MTVRELRIRYLVPEMFHPNDESRAICHAIIVNFNNLKPKADEIRRIGYKIVGVDERFRDDSKYMSLLDGWNEITRPT